MRIDIPDQEARKMLEGLRAGDPAIIASLIGLLEEEVQSFEKYPFEVIVRGESHGHWQSLEAIREEYEGSEIVTDAMNGRIRLEVVDRLRGITYEGRAIWEA